MDLKDRRLPLRRRRVPLNQARADRLDLKLALFWGILQGDWMMRAL